LQRQSTKIHHCFDHFENLSLIKVETFHSQAISNTLWSLATLDDASPKSCFDAVAEEAIKQVG